MPYKQVLDGFENPDPPLEFERNTVSRPFRLFLNSVLQTGIIFADCPSLRKKLHHKTFLEELVFWALKYEFPEKMTNFLLAMLPDIKYKVSVFKM